MRVAGDGEGGKIAHGGSLPCIAQTANARCMAPSAPRRLSPTTALARFHDSRHRGGMAVATIVGSGDYKYRIIEDWAKLPDGWSFKEVAAVGVDRNDNVYAFGRGEHPMMVFDRTGKFLRSL